MYVFQLVSSLSEPFPYNFHVPGTFLVLRHVRRLGELHPFYVRQTGKKFDHGIILRFVVPSVEHKGRYRNFMHFIGDRPVLECTRNIKLGRAPPIISVNF
jgi:hypothetical protein